ncbi:hypothetical protein PR048_017908 [Dryococelus australis]|uniref:Reverse transcriptase/retrotransposon-derived protein RNase H-like domain-containing protein n=1 Tax=Dryococelus australis TaxID=614101 RepID=A0ABQ9HAS8_9NEOP|nr:hypothetical protein PR048_017908 [Dryococelus australis]
MGATVAERLACSPPTQCEPGSVPGWVTGFCASGNRAGRCRWSECLLGDLPFPPPFHVAAASYSPPSPSSALKTSLLRAAKISSPTHGSPCSCSLLPTGDDSCPEERSLPSRLYRCLYWNVQKWQLLPACNLIAIKPNVYSRILLANKTGVPGRLYYRCTKARVPKAGKMIIEMPCWSQYAASLHTTSSQFDIVNSHLMSTILFNFYALLVYDSTSRTAMIERVATRTVETYTMALGQILSPTLTRSCASLFLGWSVALDLDEEGRICPICASAGYTGCFAKTPWKCFPSPELSTGHFIGVTDNVKSDVERIADALDCSLSELRQAFFKMREVGLTVNPDNVTLGSNKMTFLGHLLFEGQLTIDPHHVALILKLPCPKTSNGWFHEQESAFSLLKEKLVSPPVLPDFTRCFVVHVDASSRASGAILSQRAELHSAPLAFSSPSLTEMFIVSDAPKKQVAYALSRMYDLADFENNEDHTLEDQDLDVINVGFNSALHNSIGNPPSLPFLSRPLSPPLLNIWNIAPFPSSLGDADRDCLLEEVHHKLGAAKLQLLACHYTMCSRRDRSEVTEWFSTLLLTVSGDKDYIDYYIKKELITPNWQRIMFIIKFGYKQGYIRTALVAGILISKSNSLPFRMMNFFFRAVQLEKRLLKRETSKTPHISIMVHLQTTFYHSKTTCLRIFSLPLPPCGGGSTLALPLTLKHSPPRTPIPLQEFTSLIIFTLLPQNKSPFLKRFPTPLTPLHNIPQTPDPSLPRADVQLSPLLSATGTHSPSTSAEQGKPSSGLAEKPLPKYLYILSFDWEQEEVRVVPEKYWFSSSLARRANSEARDLEGFTFCSISCTRVVLLTPSCGGARRGRNDASSVKKALASAKDRRVSVTVNFTRYSHRPQLVTRSVPHTGLNSLVVGQFLTQALSVVLPPVAWLVGCSVVGVVLVGAGSVGLDCAGLGCVGPGRVCVGCVGLGSVGVAVVGLGCVGLGCVGSSRVIVGCVVVDRVGAVSCRLPGYQVVGCQIPGFQFLDCRILGFQAVSCRLPGYQVVGCQIPGFQFLDCRILGFQAVSCRLPGYQVVGCQIPGFQFLDCRNLCFQAVSCRLPGYQVVGCQIPGFQFLDCRILGFQAVSCRLPGYQVVGCQIPALIAKLLVHEALVGKTVAFRVAVVEPLVAEPLVFEAGRQVGELVLSVLVTLIQWSLVMPAARERSTWRVVKSCNVRCACSSAVQTRRTQQEQVTRVKPGETVYCGHSETAAMHPSHTCCDVNYTATFKWLMCKLANVQCQVRGRSWMAAARGLARQPVLQRRAGNYTEANLCLTFPFMCVHHSSDWPRKTLL